MKNTRLIFTSLIAITAVAIAGGKLREENKLERRHSFKALEELRLEQTPEEERLYKKRGGEHVPHVDMSDIQEEGDASKALRRAADSHRDNASNAAEEQKIQDSFDSLHEHILVFLQKMHLSQRGDLQKMLGDPAKDKYSNEFQQEIQNLLFEAFTNQRDQAEEEAVESVVPKAEEEDLELSPYGNAVEFWETGDIQEMRQLRNVYIEDKDKLIKGFTIAVENKIEKRKPVSFSYGSDTDAYLDQAKEGISRLKDFGFTVTDRSQSDASYQVSIDGITAEVSIEKMMRR